MTTEELDRLVNNGELVKRAVLRQLCYDKKITPEELNHYYTDWGIIVVKKKWYERWIKKFYPSNAKLDEYMYKFIKLSTTEVDEDNSKNESNITDNFESLSETELEEALRFAIKRENYDRAAAIRDELDKRNNG